MNCVNHVDVAAVAFCRSCGKALCGSCVRGAQGTVYCEEHMPVEASPYTAPPTVPPPPPAPVAPGQPSPGLAFLLGLIPGVGAIYNGQYSKGLVHVLVMATLISILNSGLSDGIEVFFAFALAGWMFYMPFEAYHTALARQRGLPVDEFSSVLAVPGSSRGFPIGPVVLIAIGVLFLLSNFGWIHLRDVARFWPVALIGIGAYLLYARLNGNHSSEVGHEPR